MTRSATLAVLIALALAAATAEARDRGAVRLRPEPCKRDTAKPKAPDPTVLAAFEVLRRPRTAADELPAQALDALRARGLVPAVATSARRVATTAAGGGTWLVPVADVDVHMPFVCFEPPRGRRGTPRIRSFAVPRVLPALPVPPRGRFRAAPAPVPPVVPPFEPLHRTGKPRPGIAVVATRDAALYGGGALEDLKAGTAPVEIDACGPGRTVTVRGLVPDGVKTVHVTGPDGTSVRADTRENTFTIVVAADSEPLARYVVWSDARGTPRVQPLPFVWAEMLACREPADDEPRVSAGCGVADLLPVPAVRSKGSRARLRRPPPMFFPACAPFLAPVPALPHP